MQNVGFLMMWLICNIFVFQYIMSVDRRHLNEELLTGGFDYTEKASIKCLFD